MPLDEFSLIERYFCNDQRGEAVVTGIGDDAAVLNLQLDEQLVTSVDTLLADVHFPSSAAPEDIATRALHVNLSDLAAMGARPLGFLLALTLPEADAQWLEAFSESLARDASTYQCPLIGGDTTGGPLAISITVFGSVPKGQALLRSGASEGDSIYVTGTLGDAAAALSFIKGFLNKGFVESEYLLSRFYRPEPRLQEGTRLIGQASAAIDISDGLLADLGHIVRRSNVRAEIELARLPLSRALMTAGNHVQSLEWALTGGDDYELCFTVPCENVQAIEQMIQAGLLNASKIGRIIAGQGVICLNEHGEEVRFEKEGFRHF